MTPYTGNTVEEINQELKTKQIQINATLSPETKDLLKCLLKRNSNDRFDINQVLKHPALQNHLDEFKRPLSEADKKLLFDNYMFNCGSSEIVEIPEAITNKSNSNTLAVEPEVKKSVTMSERGSYRKQVNKPLNDDFKNFFDDVFVEKITKSPNNETTGNFFDLMHSSNFFKKSEHERVNEFNPSTFDAGQGKLFPERAIPNYLDESISKAPNLFDNILPEENCTNPVSIKVNQSSFENQFEISNKILQVKDSFFAIGETSDVHKESLQNDLSARRSQDGIRNSFFVNVPEEVHDEQTSFLQQQPPALISTTDQLSAKLEAKTTSQNSNIPSAIFVNYGQIKKAPLPVPMNSIVPEEPETLKKDEPVHFFSYEVHDINRSMILDKLQAQHDSLLNSNQHSSSRDIRSQSRFEGKPEQNSSSTGSEREVKLKSPPVIFINKNLSIDNQNCVQNGHHKGEILVKKNSLDEQNSSPFGTDTKPLQSPTPNIIPESHLIRRQTTEIPVSNFFNLAPHSQTGKFENAKFINADLRAPLLMMPLPQTVSNDTAVVTTKDKLTSNLLTSQGGSNDTHKLM